MVIACLGCSVRDAASSHWTSSHCDEKSEQAGELAVVLRDADGSSCVMLMGCSARGDQPQQRSAPACCESPDRTRDMPSHGATLIAPGSSSLPRCPCAVTTAQLPLDVACSGCDDPPIRFHAFFSSRYCPRSLRTSRRAHITGVAVNWCGSEVVATYNPSGEVYRFDVKRNAVGAAAAAAAASSASLPSSSSSSSSSSNSSDDDGDGSPGWR